MPSSEYAERLAARRASVAKEQRLHIRIGNARLLVFLVAAWIGWTAYSRQSFSAWWLAAPVAAFVALLVFHERVLRARQLAERAVRYYERGLARLEDRWAGAGEPGERFRDQAHPYAEDLDLFGKGGLFELLSTARTRAGEDTLARWLLEPADAATVIERQAAVAELRPKLDLREELALLGEDVRAGGDAGKLIGWAEAPATLASHRARIQAAALSVAMLAALICWAWFATPVSRVAVVCLLAINTAFGWQFRERVLQVIGHAGDAARDLSLLSTVLAGSWSVNVSFRPVWHSFARIWNRRLPLHGASPS